MSDLYDFDMLIDGMPVTGQVHLQIENRETFARGDLTAVEILSPSLHGSIAFEAASDRNLFGALMRGEGHTACITFSHKAHQPGKRCLWGQRRGYIQVGSPEDQPMLVTAEINNVVFDQALEARAA